MISEFVVVVAADHKTTRPACDLAVDAFVLFESDTGEKIRLERLTKCMQNH